MRRDFVETEFLVVVRANPLGGIDGAAFERRVDIPAGDLLRYRAEPRHHLAAEAGDPHLQTLQIGGCFDFLAKPSPHLSAGVAGGK